MKIHYSIPLFCSLFSSLNFVHAWGVVGHETVATIAQIHLFESTKRALNHIHLAPIAAWADRIKGIPQYRFASELHYTSPLEDYPPSQCHFGDKGWLKSQDLLHAISNYTFRLVDNPHDGDALKFLVHFIGDVHQPLHLTSRSRGGNSDFVIFQGRKMSLHSLWDGGLITRAVRELHNYTRPLPSRQIESSLRGTIYDSYIRYILWEGVRTWWRPAVQTTWLSCPLPLSPRALSSPSQQLLFASTSASALGEGDVERVVCPEYWARETHQVVTCAMVWPEGFEDNQPPKEVNTAAYFGPIRDNNVIERLLAQGGIRLAATLNSIFASPEDLEKGLIVDWMTEADLMVAEEEEEEALV